MVDFFYSYEDLQREVESLQERYPGRLRRKVRGRSHDGRDIEELFVGEEGAKAHILIQAGIHGREYMNCALVMKQMEEYLREQTESGVCFHVFPMVNPDGVAISQKGAEGIRDLGYRRFVEECCKEVDFRCWKANARGVDLNRNFSAGWRRYRGAEAPGPYDYKGRRCGSEPETRALLEAGEACAFQACISYHSSGDVVFWHFGSRGELLKADYKLAWALSAATGYPLRSTVATGQDRAGCSDYFMHRRRVPSVTIETGALPCPLPAGVFREICFRNRNVWSAAARTAKELAKEEKNKRFFRFL